ncbi:MAG: leucine dehydrogenase [bacterium]|nr:leucine dehydrogenase [bacterium]
MEVFKKLETADHEQVAFCVAPAVELQAIIVIHNTTLGPAIAGIRTLDYPDEEAALTDALHLSRGLTYKSATAGLNYGGGQINILRQPAEGKREAAFRALGRFIQGLGGRIIGAPDVGTGALDLTYVATETEFVAGVTLFEGSFDPSLVTASGVMMGLGVCLDETGRGKDLAGKTVALQGVGAVGAILAAKFLEAGARVLVHDHSPERLERVLKRMPSLVPREAAELLDDSVDVFCPCGKGGVVGPETLEPLAGKIVCGAANSQLDPTWDDYSQLAKRAITYAPDFVVNSGGLISVVGELENHPDQWVFAKMRQIPNLLREVFALAGEEGISTVEAAMRLGERRIKAIASLAHSYVSRKGKG